MKKKIYEDGDKLLDVLSDIGYQAEMQSEQ